MISIDAEAVKVVTVGSLTVFPSESSPSSETSDASSVNPGLLAVTETTFDKLPLSTSACLTT